MSRVHTEGSAMANAQSHPAVSASDWIAFSNWRSPFHFAEVIDREVAGLPPWFAPFAKGVVIPSDVVLRRIGCSPRAKPPGGWYPSGADMFIHGGPSEGMLVIRMGELWAVARNLDNARDTLAFPFGHTPVFTRRHEQAMHLALHCGEFGAEDLGYIWLRPCEG